METLYIPVNIKTRFEFFNGYGVAELAITGVVTLLVGLIAFLIHLATNGVTLPVLMTLIAGTATIMITTKDSLNLSMVDHTRNLLRFINGQKKYPYQYRRELDC